MNYERYQRQLILKGFGEAAQQRLAMAKVLVIGAGGLGCPALQYLAAAGVGTIGIADDDAVSLSNLQRQTLYQTAAVGQHKATTAKAFLEALNPEINITAFDLRITNRNALSLIRDYDIVVDATDNFTARYLINDACVLLKKPLVYAGIAGSEGQVAVFNVPGPTGSATTYRDLFPQPPAAGEVLTCNEGGVLGVVPGIMGTMQAAEAIKLITGWGEALVNQVLIFNIGNNTTYTLRIEPAAASKGPANEAAFLAMDYDEVCGAATSPLTIKTDSISFKKLLEDPMLVVIDVREKEEGPGLTMPHIQLPMSVIEEEMAHITASKIIFICQSGRRSLQAAQLAQQVFGHTKTIYSGSL